jgi:large subunit ribosomal protein L29
MTNDMKAKEIRELTDAEAQAKLRDLRQEMFNLRLQQQTARLERPSRIREVRRDMARLETVLRERQLRPATTPAK